jgi:hypothetical protein
MAQKRISPDAMELAVQFQYIARAFESADWPLPVTITIQEKT